MRKILTIKFVGFLTILFSVLYSINVLGQCPVAPAANPAGNLVTSSSNQTANFTVGAGQVLVIQSGTYTGSIGGLDKTGQIYVYAGATFNPSGLSNFAGKIVNCGTAFIPGFDFPNQALDSVQIRNYNVMTFTGGYNFNGNSSWLNGIGAKLTFNGGLSNFKDLYFVNNGNITVNGSFNLGAVSSPRKNTFINHDSITVTGTILLDAAIINDGFLFSKGNMTLNSQGNITNGCFFETDKAFNYSGSDTLIITGLTWVAMAGGSDVAKFQGKAVKLTGNGFIQGADFDGTSVFHGNGNMYFTGNTVYQGPAGGFGKDGLGLNFYDTGLPGCPGSCRYFDTQSAGTVNASAKKTSVTPKDNNYIPNTCSPLIFSDDCAKNKPQAGADANIIGESADLVDAVNQTWSYLAGSGPVTPAIDATTGIVTGMTKKGVYTFILKRNTTFYCADTIKLTVANFLPVAPDCPELAIPGEFIVANFSAPVLSGPTIAGQPTRSRPGGSALYQNIGTVNNGNNTALVALDMKITFVSTTDATDADGYIEFSSTATNDVRWRAWNWDAGDIQNLKVEFFVAGTSTPASFSGVWNFQDIDKPVTNPERVYFPTNVVKNYLLSSPITGVGVSTIGSELVFEGLSQNTGPSTNSQYAFSAIIENQSAFNFRIQNGGGNTSFFMNGNNFSYIPSANCTKSDQYATTEDVVLNINTVAAGLLKNDTDQDGDVITVSGVNGGAVGANVTLPSGAKVNVSSSGTFTYDPRVAFNYLKCNQVKVDSFYYQISDGDGGFDLGTVTVTITGVNDAPDAVDDAFTTNQGAGSIVLNQGSNDTDPESDLDVTTNSIVTAPKQGTTSINATTGVITYIPNGTYSGKDSLVYKVCDKGCTPVSCDNAVVRITIVPNAKDTLTVTGSTVCRSTANATVTIKGAENAVVYEAYLGASLLTSGTGTGVDLVLNVSVASLANGSNTISFKAKKTGFVTVNLTKTATVIVNPLSVGGTALATPNPVCSNQTSTISLTGQTGSIQWQRSSDGLTGWANVTGGTGATTASYTTPVETSDFFYSALVTSGTSNPCASARSTVVKVVVNPLPVTTLGVSGDVVCSNVTNASVTISGSQVGVSYQAYLNNSSVIGAAQNGNGGNLILNIPVSGLSSGWNSITIRASNTGCGARIIDDTASVKVNPLPNVGLTVSGHVVCSSFPNTSVDVTGSQAGVTYQAYLNNSSPIGTAIVSTGGDISLPIPVSGLSTGWNNITVRTFIAGCGNGQITDTAGVKVNPLPSTALVVTGQTICSNVINATVKVAGTQLEVSYQAYLNNTTALGLPVIGTGGDINISIPVSGLATGWNSITVRATIAGCGTRIIADTAGVKVDPLPSTGLTVTGNTVCSNVTNATVSVSGSQVGVLYQAYLNNITLIGGALTGNGGVLNLAIPVSGLSSGWNNITVRASNTGCGTFTISDTAGVKVDPLPITTLTVTGNTVCSNVTNATVSVAGSQTGVLYQAYLNNATLIGNAVAGNGGVLNLLIPVSGLSIGWNNITVRASNTGCGVGTIADTAGVKVDPLPSTGLAVTGSTICSNVTNATVSVSGSQVGVSYQAYLNNSTIIGNAGIGNGGVLNLLIPVSGLSSGWNSITVRASNTGCGTFTISDTAGVRVDPLPITTLTVTGNTVCSNVTNATVSVAGSQTGVSYQAYLNNTTLIGSAASGNGGVLNLFIPVSGLSIGWNNITVRASNTGCGVGSIADTAGVKVDPLPSTGLTVTGNTVCSNVTNATVSVAGSQSGVLYQAYLNNVTLIGGALPGNGGVLNLAIPVSGLSSGWNNITVRASNTGCGTFTISDTAGVKVNPLPNTGLTVTGSIVCSNAANATVSIANSQSGVSYQAYLNNITLVGSPVIGTGGGINISIPVASLVIGWNNISVRSTIAGCGTNLIVDTAGVKVNPLPSSTSAVTANPTVICAGGTTTISIANSQLEVKYRFYDGLTLLDSVIGNGGLVTKSISIPSLGLRTITVTADIQGCAVVTLIDKPTVQVNPGLNNTLAVTANPTTICFGGSTSITVANSQSGVSYQVYDGLLPIPGTILGTGSSIVFTPISGLAVGTHTFVVKATDAGCGTINLVNNPVVVVNPDPSSKVPVFNDTTVCSDAGNVRISMLNTIKGVKYDFRLSGTLVGSVTASDTTAFVVIPLASLNPTPNATTIRSLDVTGSIAACTPFVYADKAVVTINPKVSPPYSKFSDPIVCSTPTTTTVDVTITNAVVGLNYVFSLNGIKVDSVTATSTTQIFTVALSKLNPVANAIVVRKMSVTGSVKNCGLVQFSDSSIVTINPDIDPTVTTFGNDTLCSSDVNANINVSNAIVGFKYVFVNGTSRIDSVVATSTSFTHVIARTKFSPIIANQPNVFTLKVEASISGIGCFPKFLNSQPVITINPNPTGTPTFSDPTVCVAAGKAKIKITNAIKGVRYVFSLGGLEIDSLVAAASTDSLEILLSKLNPVSTQIVTRILDVKGTIPGCSDAVYTDKSTVTINPDVDPNLTTFSNDTVCSAPAGNVSIVLTDAIVGFKYVFINGTTRIDSVTALSTTFTKTIPKTKFLPQPANQINTYVLSVEGSVAGANCSPKIFIDKPVVVINPDLLVGLPVFSDTSVCPSAVTAKVNIKNAIAGVKYVFTLGGTRIDSVTATGTTASLDILISKLNPIADSIVVRSLSVTGYVGKCSPKLFTDKAVITINPEIDPAHSTFNDTTVCSTASSATIMISKAIVGVTYVFYNGTTKLDSVKATKSPMPFTIATNKFTLVPKTINTFTLTVKGFTVGAGCSAVEYTDKPKLTINLLPDSTLKVSATGPICAGGSSTITIDNTEKNVLYQIMDNGTVVDTIVGTGATNSKAVTLNLVGDRIISVRALINACAQVKLLDTAGVKVNKGSDINLAVTATDTICIGGTANVKVANAQKDVVYEVFNDLGSISNKITGANADINFTITGLSAGSHTIRVEATTAGCGPADLLAHPVIFVNPLPKDDKLIVTGDTVCSISPNAIVTLDSTTAGVIYQAMFKGKAVGAAVKGNGARITLVLPVNAANLTVGVDTIKFTGTVKGCGSVLFNKFGIVVVSPNPDKDQLTMVGDTVCSNSDSATVTLSNTQKGVYYQAIYKTVAIGKPVMSAADNQPVVLTIPTTGFVLGNNTINVSGKIDGCVAVNFTKTANVLVNILPSDTLNVKGDTVCSNLTSTTVTVFGTKVGETYQALEGANPIGNAVKSSGGNVILTLPIGTVAGTLNPSVLAHTISFRATINGCADVDLLKKATVIINQVPDTSLAVVPGPTVCFGSSTFVTLKSSVAGVSYTLIENGTKTKTSVGTGNDLVFNVKPSLLGANIYGFSATIKGCASFDLTNTATIIANRGTDSSLNVTEISPICLGENTIITVANTYATSGFQVFEGNTSISDSIPGGGTIQFVIKDLTAGLHLLVVRASTPGCGFSYMKDTARVQVNPLPDSTLQVIGDTICGNVTSTIVSVLGTKSGETYTLYEGVKQVGVPTLSAGGKVDITVPVGGATGLANGLHILSVKATIGGCDTIVLKDSAYVLINQLPDPTLKVIGDTVCSNSASTIVTILGTKKGETYQAIYNKLPIGTKEVSTGDTIILVLPVGLPAGLPIGVHKIAVRTEIPGCATITLNDSALVIVNELPADSLVLEGDTVCENSATAKVKIFNTKIGEIYQAYKGAAIGAQVKSKGGTVTLTLPVSALTIGVNKISITSSIDGCAIVNLKDSATVIVNKLPSDTLSVVGDTICESNASVIVTVYSTNVGESYQAYEFTKKLGSPVVSTGGKVELEIPVAGTLSVGLHKINVVSSINGCTDIFLKDTADVLVNEIPKVTSNVIGDTICSNSTEAHVTIQGTKATEIYVALLGGKGVSDTVVSTGGDVVLTIPRDKLSLDTNNINISVSIEGCNNVILDKLAKVIVNRLPADTLVVVGDTVCENAVFATVTIKGTSVGEKYQAYEGVGTIGQQVLSTGGDVVLTIPITGKLLVGLHKITVKSTIDGCAVVNLKDTADVLVNKIPDLALDVIGDTVCSNSDTATVQIVGTKIGEVYTAFLNSTQISDSVTSQGGIVTLKILVSNLKLDTNYVSVQSSIKGCGKQILDKRGIVIVNRLPADTLVVVGDTVCSNETTATVKIINTAKDVVYTAFLLDGTKIGQSVTSTGGDITITLPVADLKPDTNKISITATIDGCGIVNLKDSALVILNQKPSADLTLLGSIVCSTADTATVTILQSDKNVVYQAILSSNNPIGKPVIGTGGDIILKLPVNGLALDTNIVSVALNISGCAPDVLTKKAKVVVNKLPDSNLATDGSVVCEDATFAQVTIFGTEKNVTYQAELANGTQIGSPIASAGGDIILQLPVVGLVGGNNKVVIKATVDQCATVSLKDTALVVVNKLPSFTATVSGSSICKTQDGEVKITPTQMGVKYSMLVNGISTPIFVIGDDASKTLTVPDSLLTKQINTVSFDASIKACRTVPLTASGTIYRLSNDGMGITGKSLLCVKDTSTYMVSDFTGALAYSWTIRSNDGNAKILTDTSLAKVRIQVDTLNARLKVVPVGTFGRCEKDSVNFTVFVQDTISGFGKINGHDTVCVNQTDTLFVSGLKGVSSYTWVWPRDVAPIDTLYHKFVYRDTTINGVVRHDTIKVTFDPPHYVRQYLQSGIQKIVVKPYSSCRGAYSKDTIVKEVRVLDNSYAEANEYELAQMVGRLDPVQLNGSGSSVTSKNDTINEYFYKWYTDGATQAQILNPKTLNDASLLPASDETKVYLLVTNKGGYCPAKDSVIVNIRFKIDIPNVFSPNGDGVHDKWEILNITTFFPNTEVMVFNKWGSLIYKSAAGYPEPWDGTRNGEDMPVSTYYYIVDIKDGGKPFVGSVTILK